MAKSKQHFRTTCFIIDVRSAAYEMTAPGSPGLLPGN